MVTGLLILFIYAFVNIACYIWFEEAYENSEKDNEYLIPLNISLFLLGLLTAISILYFVYISR